MGALVAELAPPFGGRRASLLELTRVREIALQEVDRALPGAGHRHLGVYSEGWAYLFMPFAAERPIIAIRPP